MNFEIAAPFKFWAENPVIVDKISNNVDSVVIVSSDISKQDASLSFLSDFLEILKQYKEADDAFEEVETFINPNVPKYSNIRKLVYSPTGPIDRDYDDVRRFADAALKGIKRILKAGGKNPLLVILDSTSKYSLKNLVALLGAAEALYVPLEIRESSVCKISKVQLLEFSSPNISSDAVHLVSAIEAGRIVCRDIGGSDPERMSPPNVVTYVLEMFADTPINVEIIDDEKVLEKEYPLLAAVNRAARGISRHRARVIILTYIPQGSYDTTIALVGKGVTYDTGGADVKAGGVMAGMHRDKCGAAAVAGFMKTVAALQPKRVKIIGAMAMVRNSIGADSYVADEIITSKAGVRVRVGNTDAEGRMAMADVLYHMKEMVKEEKNAYLFTIATLTGHACLAVGDGYSIVMANGPAKAENVGESIQKAGEEVGDMFEISTIRREDFEFHKGKSEYEDVLQCNNLPSSRTPRGHQTPAAFLIMTSGLDKHGINSKKPLKYCHIDIAASSGPFPGIPSGAPIPALTRRFIIN